MPEECSQSLLPDYSSHATKELASWNDGIIEGMTFSKVILTTIVKHNKNDAFSKLDF